jgi:acetyl-CoA carboxylase carboxyltransferase component
VATRRLKVQEYGEKFANPYVAAASGHIDAVISPADTRKVLIHAIHVSSSKAECRPARKHGIPPF